MKSRTLNTTFLLSMNLNNHKMQSTLDKELKKSFTEHSFLFEGQVIVGKQLSICLVLQYREHLHLQFFGSVLKIQMVSADLFLQVLVFLGEQSKPPLSRNARHTLLSWEGWLSGPLGGCQILLGCTVNVEGAISKI